MKLALVMPYYRNPAMLRKHLLVWREEWSAESKCEVEVIIVDDGSPADDSAAEAIRSMWQGDSTGLPSISLYRVTEDRPWHQHGARNLGAHVAKAKWLLMTDMDHVVPCSTIMEVLRLLSGLKHNKDVLTFGRVDAPQTLTWKADHWTEFSRTRREDGSLKPHVNSFVVSKKRYWAIGGYDEDYCGVYGTDKLWRDRLYNHSRVTHLEHAPLIRVGRDVIPDASTRDATRKIEGRNSLKKQITLRKLTEGRANKPLTLAFPWEQVSL